MSLATHIEHCIIQLHHGIDITVVGGQAWVIHIVQPLEQLQLLLRCVPGICVVFVVFGGDIEGMYMVRSVPGGSCVAAALGGFDLITVYRFPCCGIAVSSPELGAFSPQGILIDHSYNRTPIHRTYAVEFLLSSVFCQGYTTTVAPQTVATVANFGYPTPPKRRLLIATDCHY